MATVAGRIRVESRATERRDTWWLEPLITVTVLGAFVVYSLWVVFDGQNYFANPYLSPFFSPCFATSCPHDTFGFIPFPLTPALLIIWAPLAFRGTCYYYRKAYYRSFFWSPPACAVPDAARRYSGESRWPFLIQNIHRYAFYPALLVAAFLWVDAVKGFIIDGHFMIGLGSLVLVLNATLLTLYSFSCHSFRHLVGGYLDVLSRHRSRYAMWRWATKLNERHMLIAWCSLIFVSLTDVYVRLVATNVLTDPRVVF